MFRTVSDQVSLWEAVLPPELLKLPDELARVDVLLGDQVFCERFFDPRIGRRAFHPNLRFLGYMGANGSSGVGHIPTPQPL